MTVRYFSGCGLSPRGRGNLARPLPTAFAVRSIPAWTGEPVGVGGWLGGVEGLSPRGRGNREREVVVAAGIGSIPAWTGEPGCLNVCAVTIGVYPRVDGGPIESYHVSPEPKQVYPRVDGGTAIVPAIGPVK